jgi:hypothetical protein
MESNKVRNGWKATSKKWIEEQQVRSGLKATSKEWIGK